VAEIILFQFQTRLHVKENNEIISKLILNIFFTCNNHGITVTNRNSACLCWTCWIPLQKTSHHPEHGSRCDATASHCGRSISAAIARIIWWP